jgi:hypothetical protein
MWSPHFRSVQGLPHQYCILPTDSRVYFSNDDP